MLAAPERKSRKRLVGSPLPRLSPPVPLKHGLPEFREASEAIGITLMPWQETAAKYLTAVNKDGRHLYREVAIVVARQQGKTTLMKPLIVAALRKGRHIMHIAQTRELPRHMFGVVADALSDEPELFPKRRGKVVWPRYGAGQEEILLENGGSYRIAAASSGGSRGWSNDIVIVDELREMDSTDVVAAFEPTMRMADDPLTVYLSNAGTDRSVVLNGLRARHGVDPALAYLEWSAAPELAPDDRAAWIAANPAIGHYPQVLPELERSYRARLLSGTMALFETEALCRWVASMEQQYVDVGLWDALPRDGHSVPRSSWMGISMDPTGERASAVLAWRNPDDTVSISVVADVKGLTVDVDGFGEGLEEIGTRYGTREAAYDPWTDADIARHARHSRVLSGRDYANASEAFVRGVETQRIRVKDDDGIIAADLRRLTRRRGQGGAYMAVKASDQEPATAALAAIRAYWLATAPGRTGLARIY